MPILILPPCGMRNEQLDVSACLLDRGLHGRLAGRRGVERAQLLAKRLLVARAKIADLQRVLIAAAADREPGGQMAEVGRGKRELDDPVGAEGRDALGIIGHAGQVQVAHGDATTSGQGEPQLHAAAAVEQCAVVGFRRQLATEASEHSVPTATSCTSADRTRRRARAGLVQLTPGRLAQLRGAGYGSARAEPRANRPAMSSADARRTARGPDR